MTFWYALHFLAGTFITQHFSTLPGWQWSWLITLLPLLFWIVKSQLGRSVLFFVLGILWASHNGHLILNHSLPEELESVDLLVEGSVASLPDISDERVRFLFDVERIEKGGQAYPSPGRVRLSWYHTEESVFAGERWQFVVRLKRPHAFLNPGGFDYEGWLFRQGIRATGYIREDARNGRKPGGSWRYSIHRLRQAVRDKIEAALSDRPEAVGLFAALAIGDRSRLSTVAWDGFTATGTSHLIAISGLHIGIVAGLMFWLMRRIWSWSKRLTLWQPAPVAAAVFALIAATGYAALAGFTLPTQRALIMLIVVFSALILRRQVSPWHSLSIALLLVLVIDPLAVSTAGFWLSFAAVAVILFALSDGSGGANRVFGWVKIQWMVVVGLIPILLWSGLRVSLVAPVVNLLLIPLFSFLVVPLVLLATLGLLVLPELMQPLVELTAQLLELCMATLVWIASFSFVSHTFNHISFLQMLLIALGVIYLLLPKGLGLRLLGSGLIAVPLLTANTPQRQLLEFTMLDIGQGLSAVVTTATHLLVYDLGPGYSGRFNAGSDIIAPYLHTKSLTHIDKLILSNGDADHVGGLSGLLEQFTPDEIVSGEPERFPALNIETCEAGMWWRWDGVDFRILSPDGSGRFRGNNASCVLLIEAAGTKILLTGDITERVESYLLAEEDRLNVDIVTVPHHGSATSSSSVFTQGVRPKYALVSSGYLNRYGFPKPQVVNNWRAVGALVLNTADSGAISFTIDSAGNLSKPDIYREAHRRYWH